MSSATAIQPSTTPLPLSAVDERLHRLFEHEAKRWSAVDASLGALPMLLDDYVRQGGKRLRPAFLLAGVMAAGDDPTTDEAIDLGAALELLHAFALIHDDVMDGSATRRGSPSLHVRLATQHRDCGGVGESRRFGEGLAILAGDLAFVYADRLVPRHPMVLDVWDELRTELTMGQYLDVSGAAFGSGNAERSRLIAMLKSGRYTVVRPLHLAAMLARRPDLSKPFQRFGEPLGRAFQLRDDVLGTFGSPSSTGKPTGDDLREAKPTLLLEIARARSTSAQAPALARVGCADLDEQGVDAVREVMLATGALAEVERQIAQDATAARFALEHAPISEEGRAELHRLLHLVIERDR